MQGKASGKAVQLGSVKKIARYGAAQRGEMYADLMGTAGVQPESEQTAPSEGFQHAVIGTRGLSIRAHFATDGRAVRLADRQVDHALRPGRRALDYGEVFAEKFRSVQKALQQVLRVRGARSQHQPAGPLVQPVDGPVHKAFGAARIGIEGILQRGALFFI